MKDQILTHLEQASYLIGKNKIKEAIELLIKLGDKISPYNTEVLKISARYHKFIEEKHNNIQTAEQEAVLYNKILESFLEKITTIKDYFQTQDQEKIHVNKKESANYEFVKNEILDDKIHSLNDIIIDDFFPSYAHKVPFGQELEDLFFKGLRSEDDFFIHGPNVIRFTKIILDLEEVNETSSHLKGLFKQDSGATNPRSLLMRAFNKISQCLYEGLTINDPRYNDEKKKMTNLLSIAALYHDIGKYIRRANHPQLGANILRNSNEAQSRKLVDILDKMGRGGNEPNVKHNRFSLVNSIVQHHDKFGVVSTGEAGLPIFSDILYFGSDNHETSIKGIKKNITSVMMINLADIAAVNRADVQKRNLSHELANKIYAIRLKIRKDRLNQNGQYETTKKDIEMEKQYLQELLNLCEDEDSCLGLDQFKISNVLEDWRTIMSAVDDHNIGGSRIRVKTYLIDLEKNPARTIKRILRLLHESAHRSNARILNEPSYLSQTMVESVLVSTLGSYQFESFCSYFAHIAKMDYALEFFRAILCTCIRNKIHGKSADVINEELSKPLDNTLEGQNPSLSQKIDYSNSLLIWEADILSGLPNPEKLKLARIIISKFVKVIEALTMRYAGVVNPDNMSNPRRFGFNLRELTRDKNIMGQVIHLLCNEGDAKEPIALSWIVDEVTIWSFD